ncbi:MAG: lamin tail domain-containing protein [bacterium]
MNNGKKIVVSNDEWTLSNRGFEQAPDTAKFATNIAQWFAGGKPGKFHAYSSNFGLTQSSLANALKQAGHQWTVGTDIKFDLPTLLEYDGIFLGGDAADNNVLIEYVKAGGCVYLAGGTGWGGSVAEANRWKAFLNAFGLKFAPTYNGVSGNQATNSEHPIFVGVSSLYTVNGNSIIDIDAESDTNQVLVSHSSGGLYAVFDSSLAAPKVVISNIFFDGLVNYVESDEYIEISNAGTSHADISGWKINAGSLNQDFTFPSDTTLKSGQSYRVYTNEEHPESGGFSFKSGRAIWNNQGDIGYLYNASGDLVSSFAYGDKKE